MLHWQILIGLALGVGAGIAFATLGGAPFADDWISPFGRMFVNALKLIAVPLVFVSLVRGIASLSDTHKLSRIGGRTLLVFVLTAVIAVLIGLGLANALRPGEQIPPEMRAQLEQTYGGEAESSASKAAAAKDRGPLQILVDVVPENVFQSFTSNSAMLQVIFVALLMGVAMIQLGAERTRPLLAVLEALDHVIIRVVELIMKAAPLGVFALMVSMITTVSGGNLGEILHLLRALGLYCVAVLLALVLHTFGTYSLFVATWTPFKVREFFRRISTVMLVAFTTSSSGATLPVTKEVCEKELGIHEEITSFVLPLGATVNMDGTATYQAIATLFIAQALGIPLDFFAQVTVLVTALLAAVGTASVPGAGVIMLVIILEAVNVPVEGIALIIGVDRLIDMGRTVTNVAGDCVTSAVVGAREGRITPVIRATTE